jgi:long-subunit fatty acid transport protein
VSGPHPLDRDTLSGSSPFAVSVASRALLSLACAAALLPGAAVAGGYTIPVRGVRALSIGGAEIAGASGASALWSNPANLDATEVSLEAALIDLRARYQREPGGVTVENQADLKANPTLVGIYRLNDHFSFALGAYAPWAGQLAFPEDGPQRYAMVRNDASLFLYIHAAMAVRIGDLRLGGGVQNVIADVQQDVVLSAYTGLFGFAEDPELDVASHFELSDPLTFTGNFGAAYDLGPVTLAASVQLPFTVEGTAKFEQRLPTSVFFDNVEVVGDQATLSIPFPMAVRGGLSVRAHERVRLEAGFIWEDWSVQQRLRIEPQGMSLSGVPAIGEYKIGPAVLEKRMHDTVSVHLGADVEPVDGLHLRAGGLWESSAFEDDTFSLGLPDDTKVAVCLGASWSFAVFRLDVGLSRIFQGERVVSTSELRQVNPTNPAASTLIGNGTYETGYWIGGLGFAWIPGSSEDLGPASRTLDVSTDVE